MGVIMMRFIKAFLFGIIGLFIVITLLSLLISGNVRVSRVVIINTADAGKVYNQIANFDNWKNWHPIFTIDSAKITRHIPAIVGKDAGCIILHRGKEVEIKSITADSSAVRFMLKSEGENDIENNIVFTQLPNQHAVQVEWRALTRLNWYPWEKFYAIFMDKITGPGYETALNGLKDYIEKNP
ncbi:hypothetical protein [Ferruginibacter sp.]|uniref:hypothetical protein n=1 Tax=Ferruginibacter sp. TaxID=1940288 RepID=UPI0026595FB4|nr:hypothetical protein [Ferruginibacter sp.]